MVIGPHFEIQTWKKKKILNAKQEKHLPNKKNQGKFVVKKRTPKPGCVLKSLYYFWHYQMIAYHTLHQ